MKIFQTELGYKLTPINSFVNVSKRFDDFLHHEKFKFIYRVLSVSMPWLF